MNLVDQALQHYDARWTEAQERDWLIALDWVETIERSHAENQPKFSLKEWLEIFPEIVDLAPDKVTELRDERRATILQQAKTQFIIARTPFLPDDQKPILNAYLKLKVDDYLEQLDRQLSFFSMLASRKQGKTNGLTDEMIDQARQVPIQDFVPTPLKRSGNRLIGLCPLHHEKSPSFIVYPDQNSFWCFGCNKGGSVIDLVMLQNKCEFKEAIEQIAGKKEQ